MKGDKGWEGVIKLEKWGDIVYGWSLTQMKFGSSDLENYLLASMTLESAE
jgi:hypothetical protein